MSRHVLLRAELLDGLDEDGNARVIIAYADGTASGHSRVRFVDPAAIIDFDPDAEYVMDRWGQCSLATAQAESA